MISRSKIELYDLTFEKFLDRKHRKYEENPMICNGMNFRLFHFLECDYLEIIEKGFNG